MKTVTPACNNDQKNQKGEHAVFKHSDSKSIGLV
jgi:hypothetical protein